MAVQATASIVLLASLFILFLLLLVPGKYSSSPVAITYDTLRRRVENHFAGEQEAKLQILGKTVADVTRSSLFIGLFAGVLVGAAALPFVPHWLAMVLGVVSFAGGIALSQAGLNIEFQRWQARVFADVPNLVSFAPSFLKVGGITLRDSISMTVPFLTGPLKDELWIAIDKVKRTGNTRDAFDELAARVDHPCMNSICLRISTAWDASPSPDLFADLSDQLQDVEELAAAGTTAGKAGMLALTCVLGLLGSMIVIGYPMWIYLSLQMTRGFGG